MARKRAAESDWNSIALPWDKMPEQGTEEYAKWASQFTSTLDLRSKLIEHEQLIASLQRKAHLEDLEMEAKELELIKTRRESRQAAAQRSEQGLLVLDQVITSSFVRDVMKFLHEWEAQADSSAGLKVIINSPGGNVSDGLAVYDMLRSLSDKGHEVTTVSVGMAASMGGVLLQAGDRRFMGVSASLLIHEIRGGAWGTLGEMQDEMEYWKQLTDRLLDILSNRATLSREEVAKRWHRKDWWLTSEQALEAGFIDEIGAG